MRLLLAIAIAAVLAGCCRERHDLKPDLPGAGTVVAPEVVVVEKRVYVPIPAAITRPEPIAEGPIAQCFEVAAQRRAALERANAKLSQCAAVQGTEVQP
ncbi:hypothetical protein [uncultured Luteimonas sp.]|uniref:hypothetical protein n=1 Tax=uncultured Luteimonas sp. TaxID=453144 RepID=UPI00263744F5|nr:hypothetical protein [uncultured Luteimonas sp.]